MKTLFTICLWPVSFIGAGIILAILWRLFKLGWNIGKDMILWAEKKVLKKR